MTGVTMNVPTTCVCTDARKENMRIDRIKHHAPPPRWDRYGSQHQIHCYLATNSSYEAEATNSRLRIAELEAELRKSHDLLDSWAIEHDPRSAISHHDTPERWR